MTMLAPSASTSFWCIATPVVVIPTTFASLNTASSPCALWSSCLCLRSKNLNKHRTQGHFGSCKGEAVVCTTSWLGWEMVERGEEGVCKEVLGLPLSIGWLDSHRIPLGVVEVGLFGWRVAGTRGKQHCCSILHTRNATNSLEFSNSRYYMGDRRKAIPKHQHRSLAMMGLWTRESHIPARAARQRRNIHLAIRPARRWRDSVSSACRQCWQRVILSVRDRAHTLRPFLVV